jgi:hypothetical protein
MMAEVITPSFFLEDRCIEWFVRGEAAGAITATDADFSQFLKSIKLDG